MTKGETMAVLAFLGKFYEDKDVNDDGLVTAWHVMLADLDQVDVLIAARDHAASSRHWPHVSQIRERAAKRAVRAPAAELAWGEVWRKAATHGLASVPAFSHPLIAAAVEDVGWRSICMATDDNVGVVRAHFYRTFEAHQERAVTDANV